MNNNWWWYGDIDVDAYHCERDADLNGDDDDDADERKNLGGILDFTAGCGGATLIDGWTSS